MTDQTDPAALVKERGPDWEGFCRDLLDEWPARDIDGFELFEAALRNGLICEIPGGYDPEQHIDAEGICPEKGDPWYEYAFGERQSAKDPAALVKPLVWTDSAFVVAFGVPEAEGIFLKYYIDKETKGYSLSLCSELIGKYKTIKAAKAAAQADHEARILSALTVIDAKALVKAALREAAELVAGHSEFVRSLDCSRHLQKRSEGDRLGLAYVEAILALIEEDKTDD